MQELEDVRCFKISVCFGDDARLGDFDADENVTFTVLAFAGLKKAAQDFGFGWVGAGVQGFLGLDVAHV